MFDKNNNRAVSPVIGVILMVAITVILAAVIGAFVLGLGDDLGNSSAPSTQLSVSTGAESKQVDLIHGGGDELDLTNDFTVTVNGAVDDGASFSSSPLTAGGESTVTITDETVSDGETVDLRLRHDPSGSIMYSGEVQIGTTPTEG